HTCATPFPYTTLFRSSWLLDAAYPLWSTKGVDPAGGFFERLGQDGKPFAEPRRSRVTPRQAYCFAMGPALGWKGDAAALVKHGLDRKSTRLNSSHSQI